MTQATTAFSALQTAIQEADQDYQRYLTHLSERKMVNTDPGWHKRLSDIINTELPELMGRLIAELDLQREFQLLHHFVRNFEDAAFVLHHMKELVLKELAAPEISNPFKPVERLIALCHEMPRVVAGLIIDPFSRKIDG